MQNSEKSMRPKNGRRPAAGRKRRNCHVRPGGRRKKPAQFGRTPLKPVTCRAEYAILYTFIGKRSGRPPAAKGRACPQNARDSPEYKKK